MATKGLQGYPQIKRGRSRRRPGISRFARMNPGSEEPSSSTGQRVCDFIVAVTEFHGFTSLELTNMIRDSDDNVLQTFTKSGSLIEIELDKLARHLPLHLIGKVILANRDEASLKYLLCGVRLLHSLCDLAPRHPKLEQILLDDVKVSEQLLELIFYLLTFLIMFRQENQNSSHAPLLHSALVACSLYLLTGCISSQWQDIAGVLISHCKVEIFMDVAFAAIGVDIKLLHMKLSGQCADLYTKPSTCVEEALYYLCQQCEASLQFLQSLFQQKSFRERFVKNKELCVKGGVLLLAKAILNLNTSPLYRELSSVNAAVSRLKSRILSILLHLCEAESASYLDDVASTPQSMDLAKSVASEVLELLKNLVIDPKQLCGLPYQNYPIGLLQLNAMRLADILSDDSNFRSYIRIYFTDVLVAAISIPHQEFLSSWCSSDLPIREEDVSLEYDLFVAAGWLLNLLLSSDPLNIMDCGSNFIHSNMPRASYAHQRTSYLVKVIANLHCYVPEICQEEENIFLNKFIESLKSTLPKLSAPDAGKAGIINRNLSSLLNHAVYLTPQYLNVDDVQLLRVFVMRCETLIASSPEYEVRELQESYYEVPMCADKSSQLITNDQLQEIQSGGGFSSLSLEKACLNQTNRKDNLKEGTSENSAFQADNQFYVNSDARDQTGDSTWQGKLEQVKEIERDNQNVETSGSDSSSTLVKTSNDQKHDVDFPNSNEPMKECESKVLKEAEKFETLRGEEKQRRKRKRTLMNDSQVSQIEDALMKEPDMQRNPASLQSWAEQLSSHGSEVTSSQLKNWLNNRKARLARAAKDVRAQFEGDNLFPDKHSGKAVGSHCDSEESPAEDMNKVPRISPICKETDVLLKGIGIASAGLVQRRPGQQVVLIDGEGEEIGKGKVFQVQGKWYGYNLEESELCIVDVVELKAERNKPLPYPCEANFTTFDEAEKKLGLMRVLWNSNKLFMLPPQ